MCELRMGTKASRLFRLTDMLKFTVYGMLWPYRLLTTIFECAKCSNAFDRWFRFQNLNTFELNRMHLFELPASCMALECYVLFMKIGIFVFPVKIAGAVLPHLN